GVVTLVVNLLAARRPGSSGNYFFETWLVGMCLTGLLQRHVANSFQSFVSGTERNMFVGFSGLLLLFLVLCVAPLFQSLASKEPAAGEMVLRLPSGSAPFSEQLLEDVRTSPRPIFCDDVVRSMAQPPTSFLVRQALGAESGAVPVIEHTIYQDA